MESIELMENKADNVESVEQAVELYAEVSDLMKTLKDIKDNMRERIAHYMKAYEVERLDTELITVGYTTPSIKTEVDERAWEEYLKKDLALAKYETEREVKRTSFLVDITPDPKIYIRLKR